MLASKSSITPSQGARQRPKSASNGSVTPKHSRSLQGIKQPRASTPSSDSSMMEPHKRSSRSSRKAKAGQEGLEGEGLNTSSQLDTGASTSQASYEPSKEAADSIVAPHALPKRSAKRRSQRLAGLGLAAGTESSANETDDERGMPDIGQLSISAPSSRGQWDMPAPAVERKEALNWQQSLTAKSASPAASKAKRPARPKSMGVNERSLPAPVPAPAPAASAATDSALTWQQELLRGSAPTSASSGGALDWPGTPKVNNSPTKQRNGGKKRGSGDSAPVQQSQEDLFAMDDVFHNNASGSPKPPKAGAVRTGTRSAPPAQQQKGGRAASIEPASAASLYASPAFSNSPSPHMLPTPSRLTKRSELVQA